MKDMRIVEARTDALNQIKRSRAGREAIAEWDPLVTTRAGELACIEAAKSGEENARLYLFIRSIPHIGSALKKYLGPNSQIAQVRADSGDANDFVSESMEAVVNALDKYKPEKVTAGKSLINDFSMWILNAMKTRGSQLNTASNRGYMSGKIHRTEAPPSLSSYDAIEGGEDAEIATSTYDVSKKVNLLDAWKSFVNDDSLDRGPSPSPREVLKFFLDEEHFDVEAASKQFNKTMMTIRTKLSTIAPTLEKHGLTYDDFGALVKSTRGKDLADTL